MITLKNAADKLALDMLLDSKITGEKDNLKIKVIVTQGDLTSTKTDLFWSKNDLGSVAQWFDQLGRDWNYFQSNLWLKDSNISFHHLCFDQKDTYICIFLNKQLKPDFEPIQTRVQDNFGVSDSIAVLNNVQKDKGGCFLYFSLKWEEIMRISQSVNRIYSEHRDELESKEETEWKKKANEIETLKELILSKRETNNVDFTNKFNGLSLKLISYGYARNPDDPKNLIEEIERLTHSNELDYSNEELNEYEEDDDWLDIGVEVTQGDHKFSSSVWECMTAYDLNRVKDWFHTLSENQLPEPLDISFLDRELSFNYISKIEGGVFIGVGLSSLFELDFIPKQFHPHFYDYNSFDDMLESRDPYKYRKMPVFALKKEDLKRITTQLETILRKLPFPRETE